MTTTELLVARTILISLGVTFFISAWALQRDKGTSRQVWSWAIAGATGSALIPWFRNGHGLAVLAVTMVFAAPLLWALRGDIRNRSALMISIDLSGLVALVVAVLLIR